MKTVVTIWKFSRPHTIIGSIISILTLYFIICDKRGEHYPLYLAMALTIGVCCNVFIVGINQIADVEVDKINKPYLPIAAGVLTIPQARMIVFSSLFISLSLSLLITPYLFGIIALAAVIGWGYSMPPLSLKRHHVTAALSITLVRGVLLNIGGFLVFNYLVNHTLDMPTNVKILSLFVIVFSIVISWFKDLSDMEGDAKFNIKTLAITYSPKTALVAGNALVICAYLLTIFLKYPDISSPQPRSGNSIILFSGHIGLLGLFILNGFSIRLDRHLSIKKFYKRFWWFFFAEYLLYLAAYTVKV